MSLNDLSAVNPKITDESRLDIKVGNIDCLSVINSEIRQYQQRDFKLNSGTGQLSLIDTTNAIGSTTIPANTLKNGSKIKIRAFCTINYSANNLFNLYFRANGVRYIVDNNFQLSNTYLANSTLYIEHDILFRFGSTVLVYTKLEFQNPVVPPSLTEGSKERFNFFNLSTTIDPTVNNTFDVQSIFNISGGNLRCNDLSISLII